jgi:hypothetical protein
MRKPQYWDLSKSGSLLKSGNPPTQLPCDRSNQAAVGGATPPFRIPERDVVFRIFIMIYQNIGRNVGWNIDDGIHIVREALKRVGLNDIAARIEHYDCEVWHPQKAEECISILSALPRASLLHEAYLLLKDLSADDAAQLILPEMETVQKKVDSIVTAIEVPPAILHGDATAIAS